MILPQALVEPFCTIRAVMDRSPPTLLQAVTADFMSEGHFIGHIRRMRTLYQARQQCLVEVLERRLGHFFKIAPVDAGMHLIAWLPTHLDDQEIARQLAQQGVHTYALSDYCLQRYLPPALLIGFAGTAQDQAHAKVDALVNALKTVGQAL
ncbi:HTH-type transcriptional regulatory protein GabR [compost metagenome]